MGKKMKFILKCAAVVVGAIVVTDIAIVVIALNI